MPGAVALNYYGYPILCVPSSSVAPCHLLPSSYSVQCRRCPGPSTPHISYLRISDSRPSFSTASFCHPPSRNSLSREDITQGRTPSRWVWEQHRSRSHYAKEDFVFLSIYSRKISSEASESSRNWRNLYTSLTLYCIQVWLHTPIHTLKPTNQPDSEQFH